MIRNYQEQTLSIETHFSNFNPKEYLNEFYAKKPEEDLGEDFSLAWFASMYDKLQPKGKMLEFGVGGAIYSLITASKYVAEIHVSDTITTCLQEIKDWQEGRGFHWQEYFRRARAIETKKNKQTLQEREDMLRKKITELLLLDEREEPPQELYEAYDVLGLHFVSESTTRSCKEFKTHTKNALHYLRPGGLLMMGSLKESSAYKVGEKWFPAVPVNESSLEDFLKSLGISIIQMMSITTYDYKRRIGGYIYAGGIKKR